MKIQPLKRRATLGSTNIRPDVLPESNESNNNDNSSNLVGPPASCPFSAIHHLTKGGPVKITNYTNSRQIVDSLHLKTNVCNKKVLSLSLSHSNRCLCLQGNYCLGSLMQPGLRTNNDPERPESVILKQAVDFFQEYFHSKK